MKRIIVLLAGLLLAGCATPIQPPPPSDPPATPPPSMPASGFLSRIVDCDSLHRAVALYEASLAVRTPTPDETRAAGIARVLIAVQCGSTQGVTFIEATEEEETSDGLPWPPQPKTLTVAGSRYALVVPFSIIQDPTGVFAAAPDGMETRSIGPLYRRVIPRGTPPDPKGCLYAIPAAYAIRVERRPSYMLPIGCR